MLFERQADKVTANLAQATLSKLLYKCEDKNVNSKLISSFFSFCMQCLKCASPHLSLKDVNACSAEEYIASWKKVSSI